MRAGEFKGGSTLLFLELGVQGGSIFLQLMSTYFLKYSNHDDHQEKKVDYMYFYISVQQAVISLTSFLNFLWLKESCEVEHPLLDPQLVKSHQL